MSKRKSIILKTTALTLSMILLLEVLFPTVAWALTSGPTAPEVYGHQPVDATDNVSLVTGDFNYTLPITSIPEYPMAIGYNSQGGMDQDAGIFGFSVNGFSGAIGRSMQGLPDDLNGAPRRYEYDNQKNWRASVTGTLSVTSVPTEGIGLGLGVSLMVGFDNYKGMFGGVGVMLGLNAKVLKLPVNVGVTANVSSEIETKPDRSEIDLNLNASVQYGILNLGGVISSTYGVSGGVGINYANFSYQVKGRPGGKLRSSLYYQGYNLKDMLNTPGITDFSNQTNTATSLLPSLPSVIATTKGFGVSLTVPIGSNITVTGTYNDFNYGNLNATKDAYGFMYLKNYDRNNRNHLADFTIEGENSYDHSFRNSPAYLQRDFFVVNAQGFSGSMQLHQDQHGVVSRNYNRYQNRDLGLIGLNTERKETESWTSVSRASVNKQLDILKLLKKSDEEGEKDFDKTIFVEKELKSLTSNEYDFSDNKAKFKMRGDMTGEFNLASADGRDYDPNNYDLVHVQGTGGGPKFSFLKMEQDMPLYSPEIPEAVNKKYKQEGAIKNSTNIDYFTVGEVITQFASVSDVDPKTNLKFGESYYTHHKIINAGNKQTYAKLDDSKLEDFNYLKYLKGLKTAQPNLENAIADIRVKSAEGLLYIYNLPVFNHSSKSLQLTGKGIAPPIKDGNDYASFSEGGKKKSRNKIKEIEQYSYPYAWMLTAVVGPDYIDFDDVPGPSEGDLGYWVKFKYVQAATQYKWRFPFNGMEHNPVANHVVDDDAYNVSMGTKEIYYVSEIESSEHVSKFVYAKRFDGIDAAGDDLFNGDAYNSLNQKNKSTGDLTGKNSQYCVYRTELYRKHFDGESSSKRALTPKRGLLRVTQFTYDYSTCPGISNNITNNGYSVSAANVEYHASRGVSGATVGTGKLTLRKVQHISYEGGESNSVTLPAYDFNYTFDTNPEYNPTYDHHQVDQWGNYSKNSRTLLPNATGPIKDYNGDVTPNLNYYHSYTELDKNQADENAKAYKLSKVGLPSGGFLQVDFESKGYGKVQNKTPYVMRQLKRDIVVDNATKLLKVSVDITDLNRDSKKLEDLYIDGVSRDVFGELAFYESNNIANPAREDELFISRETATIDHFGAVSLSGGRAYQEVFLKDKKKPTERIPLVSEYRNYLFGESVKMKAVKENLGVGCKLGPILAKYQTLEKDQPLDAVKKMIANVRNYFVKDDKFKENFINCFGNADNIVFQHLSFIRTPVYKEKYTGARVQRLSFNDNFHYGTTASGTGKTDRPNNYVTNYFYDEDGTGKGIAEGVATLEPGGGESCVIDLRNKQGIGFFPSPTIMQAKTTVETAYAVQNESASVGQKISRKKGKTEYLFYSPKDSEYLFENNWKAGDKVPEKGKANGNIFLMGVMSWLIIKMRLWPTKKKITIKVPIPVPLHVKWHREDHYHLRSYAYADQTDIFGRPKSIIQYSGTGSEVTRTQYNYFGKDEGVKVYDGSAGGPNNDPFATQNTSIKPGRMDQTWSEAYFTKESRIKVIAPLNLLHANTERNFSYTNMKYTYVPPILKEIISSSTIDNSTSVVSMTGFDFYTGQPVETKSADSYGNTKIARSVPAYWKYPKMGPASLNLENLNMLTASTASYMYLNTADNDHLLGVGINEWSQDQVKFANTPRTTGKVYTSTDFNYQYEVLDKDAIEKLYSTNGKTRPAATVYPSNKVVSTYIRDAKWVSKPIKTYSYETSLKADGTFSAYSPFVWGTTPASNTGWKALSTNTLFDAYGRVVETKDILEKYASAHFGYNFSYSTAVVGNATLAGAAFAGAENAYGIASNGKILDDPRVALTDAELMQSCPKISADKTFTYSNYTSGTQAKVLTICVPATPVFNVPFARFVVSYNNTQGKSLNRTMYISYNENKDFKIISDRGELFKGFYTIQQSLLGGCSNNVKLAFEPSVFSSLDAAFTNSGYTVSSTSEYLPLCSMSNIVYALSDNDCGSADAHTGKYVFLLKGGNKKGTRFEVDFSTLPPAEKRKYKAIVWVHNNSPKQTALVVEGSSAGTVLKSATLATPYLTAGNWSLLRLEVDPGSNTKLVFYVQNPSTSGNAIYDDFRVLPYQATMENSIYDHLTGRVTARLDNENFATYYIYDLRGRLLEVKTEMEKSGPQTIKKYLYNEQKGTN